MIRLDTPALTLPTHQDVPHSHHMRLMSDASRVPQNATTRSSAKSPGSRALSPSRSSRSTSANFAPVRSSNRELHSTSTAVALAGGIDCGTADAFEMRVQEEVRRNEVSETPPLKLLAAGGRVRVGWGEKVQAY